MTAYIVIVIVIQLFKHYLRNKTIGGVLHAKGYFPITAYPDALYSSYYTGNLTKIVTSNLFIIEEEHNIFFSYYL